MERLLLLLGVALLPIYSFESGSVQFSHIFLALFALLFLSHRQLSITTTETLLILLTALIFGREAIALAFDPSPMSALGAPTKVQSIPILAGAFMAFNTLVVIAVARVPLDNPLFLRTIKLAIVAGVFITLAGVLYYGARITVGAEGYTRAVGTFNNPNQLAYFAVCMSSVAGLFYLYGAASRRLFLAFLAVAPFLVAASESRIGFIACGVLIIFGLAALFDRKRFGPLAFVICIAAAGTLLALYSQGMLDDLKIMQRIEATGEHRYDSVANRGYQFLIETPLELIFGLGQTVTRMRMPGWHEVHSTFWSFMITYGVIGFALFMGVWFKWAQTVFRELGFLGAALIVMPATICGLTGNGSRFTAFWILIGLSLNRSLAARRAQTQDGGSLLRPDTPRQKWGVAPQFAVVGDPNVRNRGVYGGPGLQPRRSERNPSGDVPKYPSPGP